jgi:hypothetical protein
LFRVYSIDMPRLTNGQQPTPVPNTPSASAQEITRERIAQLRAMHSSVRKFAMHVPDEFLPDMETIEILHRSVPVLLEAVEASLNESEWLRQQLKEAWSACADAEAALSAEVASREEEHREAADV